MNLSWMLYSYSSTATIQFSILFITVLEALVTTTSSITDSDVLAQNWYLKLTTKIINVYRDAIRQNMKDLTVSSAKIIQEQTIQAWASAAQSCSKDLAENTMANQRHAIERITEANQKAFGILAADLNPFKMQPMARAPNRFPSMPGASTRASPSNLDESSSPERKRLRR